MSPTRIGTLKEQAGDPSFHVMSNLVRLPHASNPVSNLGFLDMKSKWRAGWPSMEVIQALGKYLSQE